MPLPSIEVPKYKLKVPSTGKMITYRPFLVKEEKILLTAMETGDDESVLLQALFDILEKCIETKNVNIREFAPFDMEYIFLQLRAKSVGEEAEMNIVCSNEECKKSFEYAVNLTDLKVIKNKKHTNKIQLSDELGVIMKYPNMEIANTFFKNSDTEELFKMVASCIDSIYTQDEVFSHKDHTAEELENFIEQLSPEFFQKIMQFFETMPTMKNELDCKCPFCKKETKVVVRGVDDFFI